VDPTPQQSAEALDQQSQAALARCWASLSPASSMLALADWSMHLAASPGKQMALAQQGLGNAARLAEYLRACLAAGPGEARACVEPPAQDRRFAAPEWARWPFNLWHQSFLLNEQWWASATRGVRGVERHHEDQVAFWARQWLDMLSPGNQLATNPVALRRTLEEGGANLGRGLQHLLDDVYRALAELPPAGAEDFRPGRDVALTPGKVILRNRVMELIQYAPATGQVHPEPILVVPAWIMKYYILDLSPHNSLIGYLVAQGHTVFCISWKNPGEAERDLGMDDYLRLGVGAALDAIAAIVPERKVHGIGYCLGGTLLSIAAAAMARDRDMRLATLTLLAAQTDFAEPGELALFIDESQVSLLEAQMHETGYLTTAQMAGAFQMLRSYDLLWSRLVNEYLLGERRPLNDLMAWNADATRMPARMHAQYLRRLYLDNLLSSGRYPVDGRPVELNDIRVPIFSVGTATDHVAPWRSVYRIHQQVVGEVTFVLTSGGHNAGIVSEPGHPRRQYQMLVREAGGSSLAPDEWLQQAPVRQGSWWLELVPWLKAHSGAPVAPPPMGAPDQGYAPIADAPGQYVMER